MDGNGRWAFFTRSTHGGGACRWRGAVRRTVESAPALGITTLTLSAFSSDNWRRPKSEVDNLMFLLQKYLVSECAHLTERGVRLSVIGRRDRTPESLRRSIAEVEEQTSDGTCLHLRVAIDYSAFGEPARTFLAPAWQLGHVRVVEGNSLGLEQILGFFSLESRAGRTVPLATWTWDCGRWGPLGHVGHGMGWLQQSLDRGVPTLAIHPRDLERGFWPKILRLTEELLESGYEPSTPAGLLEAE
jgi:hypothetical protein